MVGVAQLAERQVVVLDVVGSSPIVHPIVIPGQASRLQAVGCWPEPYRATVSGVMRGPGSGRRSLTGLAERRSLAAGQARRGELGAGGVHGELDQAFAG